MADDSKPTKSTESAQANKNSNKKVLIIVGSVIGVLIILSIVGSMVAGYFATKAAETVFETATGTDIDVNSDGTGEMTFKGKDGEEVKITSEAEIPEGFPKSVPMYDGAKIVHAHSSTLGEEGTTYNVTAETNDSLDKVDDFYSSEFSSENGWKNMSRTASGEYVRVMTANESKDLVVILGITPDDKTGKTEITIITRNKTQK